MSTTQTSTQELAARPDGVITSSEQFTEKLAVWTGHYHVMAPFANLSGLAAQHGVIATAVVLDPDSSPTGAQEVYTGLPFLKDNQVAIAKRGLRKLAENAGISIETVRTDPRSMLFYWEVKAIATYKGLDGGLVRREATCEWDLRDGSPRLKGWTGRQIEEARKYGLRACETRAVNAVIRECGCGVKQAYTREELRKPFLMVRVAFTPDMTDPEVKRLVTQSHLAGALYPAAAPSASLPPASRAFEDVDGDVIDAEPRHVGSSAAPAAASTTSAPATTTTAPPSDEPPTQDAVRIEKVDSRNGATNGRKWTRYLIVDSRGVEHSTFDKSIYEAAEKFRASRAWVEISEEQDGNYRNLAEIVPAGQSPALDFGDGEKY